MSEILVEVMRGPILESIHRGDIAVVDSSGKLLYYIGDPFRVVSMRSSTKPLQALNVILTGAADKYNLTDEELSIMCSSHYGEDFHRKVIQGLIDKMGLTLDNLLVGPVPAPFTVDYMVDLVKRGLEWKQSNAACSGKHCGFLAACLHQQFSVDTYDKIESPVQQQILKSIAYMCEIPQEKIMIAEDGCGVPVHGIPLYNMALGFAKLCNTGNLEDEYKTACKKITSAMIKAPEMVAGTNAFNTELIKNTNGKLICKVGAEAVFGIGILGKDLGIALKIDDGNWTRPINPVVMEIMKELGILTAQELESLSQFVSPVKYKNNHDRVVGEIKTAFKMNTL